MILLPRAAAHLAATQTALEEAGLEGMVTAFTLSHSSPQPIELPPETHALAFTSLNAVEAAVAANLTRHPALCVGPSTAGAARAAGFPVLHVAETSAALSDHLTLRPQQHLVHLHGHPADLSWHKGHNITALLAYATTYADELPPAVAEAFAQGHVSHVLLLSSESAKHLHQLARKDTMGAWPANGNPPPVVALSPKVAQTAQSLGFPVMATSPRPSLPSLLDTLKSLLPRAASGPS